MTEEELKNNIELDFSDVRSKCQIILNNPNSTENEIRIVQSLLILSSSILSLLDHKQHKKPKRVAGVVTYYPFPLSEQNKEKEKE